MLLEPHRSPGIARFAPRWRHAAVVALVLACAVAPSPSADGPPELDLAVVLDIKGLEGVPPGWGYESHVEATYSIADSWRPRDDGGSSVNLPDSKEIVATWRKSTPRESPAAYLAAHGGILGLEPGDWVPIEVKTASGSGAGWDNRDRSSYSVEPYSRGWVVRTRSGAKLYINVPGITDDGQGLWMPCHPAIEATGETQVFTLTNPEIRDWARLDRTVDRALGGMIANEKETYCTARYQLKLSMALPKPAQEEVVIETADNYSTWLPRGDLFNPAKAGNRLTVTARINPRGPGAPPPKQARFRFALVDTSREKGVCLNWPKLPDAPGKGAAVEPLDLAIEQQDDLKVESLSQVATSLNLAREQQIAVDSYDFGAFGRLEVTALFPDGTTAVAHLASDGLKRQLTIPKDTDGNHIADAWDQEPESSTSHRAQVTDEDDDPPADGCKGDALPRYEEYRGFILEGEHTRTSPRRKDVFIFDRDGLGVGTFRNSKLDVRLVRDGEVGLEFGEPNRRVINPNRGFATLGPQYVIYLHKPDGAAGGDALQMGVTNSPRDVPLLPRDVEDVVINTGRIERFDLPNTIAHELAHAAHVQHHGGEVSVDAQWENGQWVPFPPDKDGCPQPVVVAGPGSAFSGDDNCIMRYNLANFYYSEKAEARRMRRADGKGELTALPYGSADLPGQQFCTSPKGTGVNAKDRPGGSKAGDAALGRCLFQFCVNWHRHPPSPEVLVAPPHSSKKCK